MSFTNRRSFLARSAAIAAVPAVAALAGGTLTGQASAVTLTDSATVPLSALPDFPTADFWHLRHGKIEVFDCHIAFTTMFAQLGVLPDYASAVGASASKGN
jgi:hypothetical protein